MSRTDLTQGFVQLGQEAELHAYLKRLNVLADHLPQTVDEMASYEMLSEKESKVLQDFAEEWSLALRAIAMKYLMSGRVAGQSGQLTVDRAGSGLPVWQEMVTLSQDKEVAAKTLKSMPDSDEIKASMLKAMLRDQMSPAPQQYALSQRIYNELIASNEIGLPRSLMSFLHLPDAESGRHCYMLGWSVIDLQSNSAVVHTMLLEDSSTRPITPKDPRIDRLRGPLYGQSNLETELMDMAIGLDHAVDSLHPKRLRRFTFGPLLSPVFSAAEGDMMALLREAAPTSQEDWALQIRMETVHSNGEFTSGGLFSTTQLQEFDPTIKRRDGYLMTDLTFHAFCENHSEAFRGVRKYVLNGSGKITAHS